MQRLREVESRSLAKGESELIRNEIQVLKVDNEVLKRENAILSEKMESSKMFKDYHLYDKTS